MGLEAFSYFEHRKNRSFFSERRRNSLLYGIGRFHHVGVRRNQHLAACVVSVASHKNPPPLAICLCLLAGLPSQAANRQPGAIRAIRAYELTLTRNLKPGTRNRQNSPSFSNFRAMRSSMMSSALSLRIGSLLLPRMRITLRRPSTLA